MTLTFLYLALQRFKRHKQAVSSQGRTSRRFGLQARMTLSYIWVTILSAFVLEIINAVLLATMSKSSGNPFVVGSIIFGLILLAAPLIGGVFGTVTTRSLVRRVNQLVMATTQIADGNSRPSVPVSGRDEIGQLEEQFNYMAEQLEESIRLRQEVIAQHARLEERTRISRELHDAISQDLFSLRMLIDGLQAALPAESPLQPYVVTLEQTVVNMTREMRALLLELRPIQLEQFGLATALEHLAETYRARLQVAITTTIVATPLSARVEHTLLRVAQEALSNAVRHGEATRITLSLTPHEKMIELIIADNGKGFSLDRREELPGFGLAMMQERIQELQGIFQLESKPDLGTRLYVCLSRENEQ